VKQGPHTPEPATSPEPPETHVITPGPFPPAWATTYTPTTLRNLPRGLQITDVRAREVLKDMIVAVVTQEGPVQRERLLRRVKSAFDVGRASPRIQAVFDTAIAEVKASDRRVCEGCGFLWLDGTEWKVRVPRDGDPLGRRSVAEVAPCELELAIRKTVDDALRIDRKTTMTYVARLYGWDRNGGIIEAAFERAVRALVKRGEIASDGDWLLRVNEQ
jgi:hypothetical protein